ncbi:MAG TPA: 2-dehydropantoate 2-reductase [Flavisolibacter sp.]|nr:2-dehydropantoate 2-reductase [Flavisolibacter sp.]
MKNIALVGLGGVGGYFGYQLLKTKKEEDKTRISFVARGLTYKVIKENGLTLLSPGTDTTSLDPDSLYEDVKLLTGVDLFILCVKEYDLENLCNQLKELVTEETLLLPLMNGVDIYERIRKIIDNGTVLPSCVYVASHIKTPGVIEHKGQPGKIFIGRDPRVKNPIPLPLIHLLQTTGLDATFMEDASQTIWMKFLFIAPFGLVTARYNVSIGTVLQDTELKQQATAIMSEILMIAQKKNIPLPQNAIEETLLKAASFPFEATTSLQLDVRERKQNNELQLFAGAILNYSKELNLEAGATNSLYKQLLQLTQSSAQNPAG